MSIDDKVVGITFDNRAFEKNVATTLVSLQKLRDSIRLTEASLSINGGQLDNDVAGAVSSLERLRESLQLTAAESDMLDLGDAASKVNLDPLAQSVDGVSTKFVALATIGITALSNITNKAVDAGINLAKSLSITPIAAGFSDYNEKLTSVKTIMNATGESIQTVNGYFNQLDEYADKTVFNLKDMTSAFAKFTNAGISLDKSVPAIKGIANMVALAGQGAEAASIAFYNLSQSLSSGFLTTIDYKSLNLANVATKEWKEQMIAGAVAAGTLRREANGTFTTMTEAGGKTYNMMSLFTEGLSDQWATAEILTKVLGDYGDTTTAIGKKAQAAAQDVKSLPMMLETLRAAVGTGWTSTFEIILGNVEESTVLFTRMTNSISGFLDRMTNSRNAMLQQWKDAGGREDLIEGVANIFKAFGAIIKPFMAALKVVLPSAISLGNVLAIVSHWFRVFTEHLIISEAASAILTKVFTLMFSVVNIGKRIFIELVQLLGHIGSMIWDLVSSLFPAKTSFNSVSEGAGNFVDKLQKLLITEASITRWFDNLKKKIENLRIILQPAVEYIQDLVNKIQLFYKQGRESAPVENTLDRVGQRAEDAQQAFGALFRFFDRVSDFMGHMVDRIAFYTKAMRDKIANLWGPPDFEPALDAINTGFFGALIFLLGKFVLQGLKLDFSNILKNMGKALDALGNHLKALTQQVKSNILIKLAGAVAILTASMVILSLIDSAALTRALVAISVGMGGLVSSMILMDKNAGVLGSGKTLSLGATLIGLSIALLFLATAMKKLSSLDPIELAKGITGVTVGMGLIVAAVKVLGGKENKANLLHAGASILLISAGLRILAAAVNAFSKMEWDTFAEGMSRLAIGLGTLVLALKLMPTSGAIQGAVAIGILAFSLNLFIAAILAYSLIPFDVLIKGTTQAALALGLIGLAMRTMPPEGKMVAAAASVLILSVALKIMAKSLKMLGEMKGADLGKGLLALTGILLLLAFAVQSFNTAIVGAGAMVIVAGAVYLLARSLKKLGEMKGGDLAKGLGAIAGVMVLLTAALVGLSIALPTLATLSLVMLAVSASVALFGGGIFFLAAGLALLARSGVKGAKAMVKVVKTFGIVAVSLVQMVGNILMRVLDEIDKAMPRIVEVTANFLIRMLEEIIRMTPIIAEAILEIIRAGFRLIREYVSEWIETGVFILLEFLRGIRDNIGEVTQTVIDIIVEFTNTLTRNAQRFIDAGTNLILAMILGIGNAIEDIIAVGVWVLDQILVGFARGVLHIGERVTQVVKVILASILSNSTEIAEAGVNFIVKFLEGISSNAKTVADAVRTFVKKILTAISEAIVGMTNDIARVMVDFLNGMAEAIERHGPNIRAAGLRLAKALLDGISLGLTSKAGGLLSTVGNVVGGTIDAAKGAVGAESPAKEFVKIGEYMAAGLALGLEKDRTAETNAGNLADRTVEKFREQLSRLSTLADIGEINPVITPVLDLSKVKKEASNLNGYLQASTLRPDASLIAARIIATSTNEATSDTAPTESSPAEVKFEQNNYSPKALTTNDIYRNTKSQIALAKEELGIS